jgi:hypothetical protein
MSERFFNRIGGRLAGDLARPLAAYAVKHRKQTTLRNRQEPILIDRALWIQPAVANVSDF